MSKRAIRLHEKHSREELVQMLEEVKRDSQYQARDGIYLLNRRGRKLADDILWAIYWHDRPQGNTEMRLEPAQAKWW